MAHLSSPEDEAAAQLAGAIHELCSRRADQILTQRGLNVRAYDVSGPQENRRLSALARLQAYEEVISMLRLHTDFELDLALINKATYAEVGSACGISRQAARKRHGRRIEEQKKLREKMGDRPLEEI